MNFWKNKRVFITGHTGFKGGWLSLLLSHLGAKVSGYALNPVGKYNFFNEVNVRGTLKNDFRKNICDLNALKKAILKTKPEIIFHLAAQSSVIESFKNSHQTVLSNILGTSNLLEASKDYKFIKSIVIITTDKVYQNYKEQKYFDENSKLGGDDIYSGSKACCEIMVHSYRKSFFEKGANIATVRAGNCFGGGDWTPERIVKDILEKFYSHNQLVLRNPEATRPWQHVLEPLVGYLLLAQKLFLKKSGKEYCQPWNFGPSIKQNMKVKNLVKIFKLKLKSKSKIIINKNDKRFHNKNFSIFESKHLNINSKKIYKKLKWKPKLNINQSVDLTVDWYLAFKQNKNLFEFTTDQISQYLKK